MKRHGWTYDKQQELWFSPNELWVAGKNNPERWSLWCLGTPNGKLAGATLISDGLRTFKAAVHAAEARDARRAR